MLLCNKPIEACPFYESIILNKPNMLERQVLMSFSYPKPAFWIDKKKSLSKMRLA